MKKVISILFCLLALICVLAACNEEQKPNTDQNGEHTHAWSEWSVSAAATCATKGEEKRTCTCGESETREISTLPHTWGDWITITPATCTQKGVQTHVCACGASAMREVPVNGVHQYTGWTVVTPASCASKGLESGTCACGANGTREIPENTEQHDYDAENTCSACGDYKDKGVVFTLKNGTYTVTDYTGDAEKVIIPQKYKNIPVTCIGREAFLECKTLLYITIPVGVTTIEKYAFYGCTVLQEINLPQGVTSVGNSAFYQCRSVKKVTLPASLTQIESYAFGDCDPKNYTAYQNGKYWGSADNPYLYLAGVVDDTVTSFDISNETRFIGKNAFFGCYSLESVAIPDSVVSIDAQAFFCCRSLTTVTFSANTQLTAIDSGAFYNCVSLESIMIPASVKMVGWRAFYGCEKLSSVTFAEKSGWVVSLYDDPASGQPVSATVLANTANAAECLTVNYAEYYWYRSE